MGNAYFDNRRSPVISERYQTVIVKLLLTELSDQITISDALSIEDVEDELFQQADLVLLDLTLGRVNNADNTMQNIQQRRVRGSIVVISSNDDPHVIRECIDKGAAGFIPKSASPDVLIPALELILSGGIYLPPEAYQESVEMPINTYKQPGKTGVVNNLTQRQKSTLKLACQGLQNKMIARELDIAENTVKLHLSAAYKALGVKNRTEAIYKLSSQGIAL